MNPFKRVPLQSLALTTAADAGQRRFIPIEQGSNTHAFFIMLAAAITIATGVATTIKNRGTIAAAYDYIGVNENGTDRVLLDARHLQLLGEMNALSAYSNERLSSTAIATYQLRELIPIWFASKMRRDPGETAFREKDPTTNTSVFVQLSPTAAANIASGGASVVTLASLTVTVEQYHNRSQKREPLYTPFFRQLTVPVASANPQQVIGLQTTNSIASLLISGDSALGLVPDIINSVAIRSDLRDYIGPNQQTVEQLGRESEAFFGGNTYVVAGSNAAAPGNGSRNPLAIFHNFVENGQLSTMVDPSETNMRIECSVQPSVIGGNSNSMVRVTICEMVRDTNAYIGPNGLERRVNRAGDLPWQKPRVAAV